MINEIKNLVSFTYFFSTRAYDPHCINNANTIKSVIVALCNIKLDPM